MSLYLLARERMKLVLQSPTPGYRALDLATAHYRYDYLEGGVQGEQDRGLAVDVERHVLSFSLSDHDARFGRYLDFDHRVHEPMKPTVYKILQVVNSIID